MHFKKIIFTCTLLFEISIWGQKPNVFLDREYWKTHPTVTDINQKIIEEHDISELTSNAFDAVCYALLEKVDNKTIKYLLSKEGNGVNKLTHDGRTYIFWAAYKNNLEIMKFLKDYGANTDIVDSHGYSLLNFAATTGQLNPKIYDFCIENGSNPSTEKNREGASALLLIAPHLKDLSMVHYFTSKGLDLHSTDDNGNGLFNYAAKSGNIQLMDSLLKLGVPCKESNVSGENAMIFASRGMRNQLNKLPFFQYLERLNISPNIVSEDGTNPLHAIARREKELEIFEYFISKGVDVNQANEKGNTPFMNAALMNDLTIVKSLSKHLKDIDHRNEQGQTALSLAVMRNSFDVIHYLIKLGASTAVKDSKGNSLFYYLLQSLRAGKMAAFKKKASLLVSEDLSVHDLHKDGNSLYHLAAETNNTSLIRWVNSKKIDINAKNNVGMTPLHIAIITAKDDKVIRLLLDLGADKTIKTAFGESSLALAMENEILKEKNTDFNFLK